MNSVDEWSKTFFFHVGLFAGILSTAAILDREMGVWNFHIEIYAVLVSARGLYTASTQVRGIILH